MLDELQGGGFRIGVGTGLCVLHAPRPRWAVWMCECMPAMSIVSLQMQRAPVT